MVDAGVSFASTGTCGGRTTTTTGSMAADSGVGEATAVLEYICIVTEPCTATTRVIGAGSAPTGISGGGITTTSLPDGPGAARSEYAAISTVCES